MFPVLFKKAVMGYTNIDGLEGMFFNLCFYGFLYRIIAFSKIMIYSINKCFIFNSNIIFYRSFTNNSSEKMHGYQNMKFI